MKYFVKNDAGGSCSAEAGPVANDVVVARARLNEKAREIVFIRPERKVIGFPK
jgi:hypothetical protein